ncbi:MAG: hypothetical protein FJY06_03025 [Bacteroidetes bacterium]|nr:hypothetical protein [Bacteroidota bacterium]
MKIVTYLNSIHQMFSPMLYFGNHAVVLPIEDLILAAISPQKKLVLSLLYCIAFFKRNYLKAWIHACVRKIAFE